MSIFAKKGGLKNSYLRHPIKSPQIKSKILARRQGKRYGNKEEHQHCGKRVQQISGHKR